MSDSDTALCYPLTLRVICRTVPSMFSMMLANGRGRNLVRKFIQALFTMAPQNLLGLAEFYLRPTLAQGLGPFNGQVIRQRIFEKIFCEFHVARIVETGTYRGTTAEYFATCGVPLLSVEVNRRYFAYSCQRLAHSPNVSLYNANSVRFLKEQVTLGTFLKGFTIFYLDAHWEERLPLRA